MNATDVRCFPPFSQETVSLGDLIARPTELGRANWRDLPSLPGIYIVILKSNTPVEFTSSPGSAKFAKSEDLDVLHSKWNRIQRKATTDILYIGKGDSIRSRVSQLARFGAGRAKNHAGGEWLWQVHNIGNAKVLMQSCPNGKQVGFENWLLEKFHREHGEYPLANRKGPDGDERWRPSAN